MLGRLIISTASLTLWVPCSTALGTVILKELFDYGMQHYKERDVIFLKSLDTLMADPLPTVIAREVASRSARLNAKKSFIIIQFQLHVASPLVPAYPIFRQYLDEMKGVSLGPKPAGPLVRRARQQ